ncbi:TauD/TfdA family dioxygenase [Aeromicrobium sp. REDSEA-S32_B7]|nr:TauD/TfdA family dioxygenase [Aeromicrobium sp. REDSEA-S32_B7]
MTHCPISILSAVDFNDEVIPRDDLVRTARDMLDEHGYVQLVNVPDDFHYVDFASKFGDFVPNYGGPVVGDVRPEPGMEDVYHAGNTRPLTPHTEGYDFTTPPPRYLMLWCVTPASGEGGETTIGDTKPWIEALDDSDREHLYSTVFHWKTTDGIARKGLDLHTEHPVLEDMGAPTPTVRFSCNNLLHEDDDVAVRLQAEWQRRYADEAVWIRYHRNDVLLWDNWRVLHARNAFSDPQRHLRRLQIRPAGVLAGVQG